MKRQDREPSCLFLVLGRSRTGSNLLIHMLRQHPEIECKGEIFSSVTADAWRDVLRELREGPTAWTGFKMFYYHAGGVGSDLWRHLEADVELPVMHVKRRNRLRVEVSRALAAQTGQWALGEVDDAAAKKKVSLDPVELERAFEKTAAEEALFEERFAAHPRLDVEYDQLARSPIATCEEAVRFLGLAPADAKPTMRRQNPEPLPELVANFSELRRCFSNTKWAPFFDEELL